MPNMDIKENFKPNRDFKLLAQVRETLRYYHYALSTEKNYCQWILRYIYFYNKEHHPQDLGALEVERYLSRLASTYKVSASTQRQALNALVFLYREVLQIPSEDKILPVRAN